VANPFGEIGFRGGYFVEIRCHYIYPFDDC
jgi:hypothetical protein